MDIRSVDGGIVVALSRRNLEQLLAGLGLDATDHLGVPSIHRMTSKGVLVVQAEENEVHYDRPEGGPGPGLEPFLKGSH